jgi:hypothetical protein
MKLKIFLAIPVMACAAQAKGPRFFEKGTLPQMNSVECGYEEKGAAGISGILGVTDSQHSKTRQMLCQEHLLRSDRTEYRIRPKEEKHPALLPVGRKQSSGLLRIECTCVFLNWTVGSANILWFP